MAARTVYVELLGEGVEVWRPVEVEAESDDIVCLPDTAPSDEHWALGLQAVFGANGATCSYQASTRDARTVGLASAA